MFALGTVACALAPGIGALIAARTVQGLAGGLVAGSGMALITSLYSARLRTRIIAMTQGTFTACHLSGPVIGGMFAAISWWRGSFWVMVPFMLAFAGIAYARIPEGIGDETFARLREHFDEPEIVELCMNVALFVGFGRMGAVLHMVDDLPDRFQADGRVTPWGDGDVVLIPDRAPAG